MTIIMLWEFYFKHFGVTASQYSLQHSGIAIIILLITKHDSIGLAFDHALSFVKTLLDWVIMIIIIVFAVIDIVGRFSLLTYRGLISTFYCLSWRENWLCLCCSPFC